MAQVSLEERKKELSSDGVKRRVTRSKLRKTLAALQKLEPKCLENIERVVNGQDMDKEVTSTSKWVIQQLQSLAKNAVQEEIDYNNLRFRAMELEQQESGEEGEEAQEEPKPRFSLYALPTKKDLE